MDFEKLDISHMGVIAEAVEAHGFLSCQLSAVSLFCYADKYETEICESGGFIFIMQKRHIPQLSGRRLVCYFMPVELADGEYGESTEALSVALSKLLDYHKAMSGEPFIIWGVAEDMKDRFLSASDKIGLSGEFIADRDWAEYLHTPENLIDMKGKRFHAKKNAVNQFIRNNSDFCYISINSSNIAEVAEFQERLLCGARKFMPNENTIKSLNDEHIAINRGLSNYEALSLRGGIIRIDGDISAYVLGGGVTSDTFDVAFEKGLRGFNGIFQVLEREMLKANISGYKYINREEDLGEQNLRFAKERLRPDILLMKYVFISGN